MPTLGNQHLPSGETLHVPYNTRPPTSGPHLPSIARWGLHTQPIPHELQVHNLEDGGVLVQYNCRDCAALIATLEAIVSRCSDKVGSYANGIKLASELLLYQLLTQFLPGLDHQGETLGPPFLDARLHSMRSDGVDDQRS